MSNMEINLIQQIAIFVIPLLFAITLHEVAHGLVASWCGDQTARLSGRLSINPLHHIDMIGTVIVPLLSLVTTGMVFGWAKPVPTDARNMRHPRRDAALVAIAGPIANFIMAFFWGAMAALGLYLESLQYTWIGLPLTLMSIAGVSVNIWLMLLNLIPLPPLDGAQILLSLLPRRAAYEFSTIEPYSFIILIFLLATNLLGSILSPFSSMLIGLISNIFHF